MGVRFEGVRYRRVRYGGVRHKVRGRGVAGQAVQSRKVGAARINGNEVVDIDINDGANNNIDPDHRMEDDGEYNSHEDDSIDDRGNHER